MYNIQRAYAHEHVIVYKDTTLPHSIIIEDIYMDIKKTCIRIYRLTHDT